MTLPTYRQIAKPLIVTAFVASCCMATPAFADQQLEHELEIAPLEAPLDPAELVPINPFASDQPSGAADTVDCGGQTDAATIKRYFSDLREALIKPGPKARFNRFVGNAFGIRSKVGRTLYFNVENVGSVTPTRISVEEWREIDQRGAASLQNAGWRGCFLDNGKVWFQADGDGQFALTLIARDMPWASPTRGNVLP